MGGTSKISFAGYRKPQRYTDTEIEREIEREIEIEQKQYRKGYKISIQKLKRCGGSLFVHQTSGGSGPGFESIISHNDLMRCRIIV